jgi:hypothetical protein
MERKISVKLLNAYLINAFVVMLVMVLIIDVPKFLMVGTWADFRFLYWSIFPPYKVLAIVFAIPAGIAFFAITIKYNPIRKLGTAQYLTSLVMASTIYQGLSRFIEIFYWVSESDFPGLVFINGKFYFPLDVLGSVFLAIVAFNIFILPGMEDAAETKTSTFLVVLSVLSSLIACITLFFFYLPITMFTYIIMGIALAIFLIVVITVANTASKIFKLRAKTDDPTSRRALQALGIQLILAVLVMLLLILSEVGGVIGIDYEMQYFLRMVKNVLYLVLAALFLPSLIHPSRKLIDKH